MEHPYPLGRLVQHDPRSRAFALPESSVDNIKSVCWIRHAPVFNQGDLGSCTGNACLGALGTGSIYDALYANNNLPHFTEAQAVDIYSKATIGDEWPGQYPPTDTGSSGLAVAKVAKDAGWIEAYYHAFSFNAALTAVQSAPVITGVNWYNNFFYPNMETGECSLSPTENYPVGGHEICIDQLDVENKRVWFTNSWGPEWGINGRAWFSYFTWETLLNEQVDVTQLIPATITNPDSPIPPEPPVPTDPDGCLAAILGPWATKIMKQRSASKKNKIVAQASLDWMKAKGFTI